MKRVDYHDRDEDGLVSLAEVCYKILSDEDRRHGSVSYKNRAKNNKIDERRYFVRPKGVASASGVKFEINRREWDEGDGIRSNYHLLADPELIQDREPQYIFRGRKYNVTSGYIFTGC